MAGWLLVSLAGSIFFPAPSAHITKDNFDRLKGGMQRHEVEVILGGPAGDYRTGPTCSCLRGFASLAVEDESLTMLRWQGDEAEIAVWVDPNGVISWRSYALMMPEPAGAVKKLLWRWDRWQRSIHLHLDLNPAWIRAEHKHKATLPK
jgi:hypothetical protein